MKMTYHRATSSGSQKVLKVQNLQVYTKKSSKKKKEILKKSFRKILKNGAVICLDYLLLVIGKSFGNEPKGVLKHKINGYQLFKERFVKKITVKDNVMCEKEKKFQ